MSETRTDDATTSAPQRWTMPDWMGPYVPHLNVYPGRTLEAWMNDRTDMRINAYVAVMAIEMSAKVSVLSALHAAGLLKEA